MNGFRLKLDFLCSGSINKKKEQKKKKGLSYEELRLPAITSFSSGRRSNTNWTDTEFHIETVWCKHASLLIDSCCPSVRLGRHRRLSSRSTSSHHMELPAVHHGSSSPAATGYSQGQHRYGNATVSPVFLTAPPPTLSKGHLTSCLCFQAVAITSCGNFAVIGSSCGRVDVYNLQSGLHRGCYGDDNKGVFTCSCLWLVRTVCLSVTDHAPFLLSSQRSGARRRHGHPEPAVTHHRLWLAAQVLALQDQERGSAAEAKCCTS